MLAPLKKSYEKPRQSNKKQRHHFANKVMSLCCQRDNKALTSLDRILKSRDVTLPTKIYTVKAMVFPVVMYGCEIWTIKKAERQRIDAFEL